MIATNKEEVETVLREAEQIRAGENPATVTADTLHAGDGPATGASEAAGAGADPAPAPSASVEQIADLVMLLCDWPFVRAFGGSGQLAEPFRSEARKAWSEILIKYLPALVAKSGPFGVLASIYFMHGSGQYLAWQMNVQRSASSEKEAAASQP